MQKPLDDFGPLGEREHQPPSEGFSPRLAMMTFAFTTFVLGGFCFGWLFLSNWKILVQFQTTQVQLPYGPSIALPARPDIVAGPQPRAPAAPTAVAPPGAGGAPPPHLPPWGRKKPG